MSNICKKDHRNDEKFDVLPEGQKVNEGRHKCAGCAYEQGYFHGSNGMYPNFDPLVLDDSQAGIVRHKNAEAAYNMGYTDGLRAKI